MICNFCKKEKNNTKIETIDVSKLRGYPDINMRKFVFARCISCKDEDVSKIIKK